MENVVNSLSLLKFQYRISCDFPLLSFSFPFPFHFSLLFFVGNREISRYVASCQFQIYAKNALTIRSSREMIKRSFISEEYRQVVQFVVL